MIDESSMTQIELQVKKITSNSPKEPNKRFKDAFLNQEAFCLVMLAVLGHKVEDPVFFTDATLKLFDSARSYAKT